MSGEVDKVVALTYEDLQGIPHLRAARETTGELGRHDRALRTVFQAAEIALLNLTDLSVRAARDIQTGDFSSALVKSAWLLGFHRVLDCLSQMPLRLPPPENEPGNGSIGIRSSHAFEPCFNAACHLGTALRRLCENSGDVQEAVSRRSIGDPVLRLLHESRNALEMAAGWERRLAGLRLARPVPDFHVWIGGDALRLAVTGKAIDGDTFFMQFRGLHQIPEILAIEVNTCLGEAIEALRFSRLWEAVGRVAAANDLAEGIGASMAPVVDCLAASDYHEIRASLGVTSGSQSGALRKELFGENYETLAGEVERLEGGCQPGRKDAMTATEWAVQMLVGGVLRLRSQIERWRGYHLLLPRHNLGVDATKSLIGSPDAVEAVAQMRDKAAARDPAVRLAARVQHAPSRGEGTFAHFLESPDSLNAVLAKAVGKVTRSRFAQVQNRQGIFSQECPFSNGEPS